MGPLVILEKLHPPTALSYLKQPQRSDESRANQAVATFLNEVLIVLFG